MPSDKWDTLQAANANFGMDGITLSCVLIGASAGSAAANDMQALTDVGHGLLHIVSSSDRSVIVSEMRSDIVSMREQNGKKVCARCGKILEKSTGQA